MQRHSREFGWWDQLAASMTFLTRLPIPQRGILPDNALALASWSFPLVGCLIGVTAASVAASSLHWDLPVTASVLAGLAAAMVLTGGLHEDGLADTADGFGGGNTTARKLEIMKDSRIGTYGVLALLVAVGMKASCLVALADAGRLAGALIGAHAMSRAVLPGVMHLLPAARPGGLGATAGRPSQTGALSALAIGWVIGVVALGVGLSTEAMLIAIGVSAGMGVLARRQIGGYTGDVLGATQQVAELAVLLIAASRH